MVVEAAHLEAGALAAHREEAGVGEGSSSLVVEDPTNVSFRLRKSFVLNQLFKIYSNIFQCGQAIHEPIQKYSLLAKLEDSHRDHDEHVHNQGTIAIFLVRNLNALFIYLLFSYTWKLS